VDHPELVLLKPVLTSTLTRPIVIGDLHYGTLTATLVLEGREAENVANLRTFTVELALACQSVIGEKWYDAGFVSEFALAAMKLAVMMLPAGQPEASADSKALRASCKCRVGVTVDMQSTLIDLARYVSDFYREEFANAVAASAQRGTQVELDPPDAASAT